MAIASQRLTFPTFYGSEYVSGTLMDWAENRGIALAYIQPGKPQQNAYVERNNRTVRHEWLVTLELCFRPLRCPDAAQGYVFIKENQVIV